VVPKLFTKVLVGLDASPAARDALALGALLAEAYGGEVVTITAKGSPVDALQQWAKTEAADVIVVGATHRGALTRATVGGVSERLPHRAPCAVAVAPRPFADEGTPRLRMIGVAFDGSAESERALAVAAAIADCTSGTVRIIGVIESFPRPSTGYMTGDRYPELAGSAEDAVRAEIDRAVDAVPPRLSPYTAIGRGDPADPVRERHCAARTLRAVPLAGHSARSRGSTARPAAA
jgi:nucleotide-binding universal stress UspA family protein